MEDSCGLCGKTGKLTVADCCGNSICDDEDQYVMFSFERNSCHRNHSRFTLCAVHDLEKHEGHWKDCPDCRQMFETEMYVWYGTNEYNFEVLADPPSFEPTRCIECNRIIRLAEESHMIKQAGKVCEDCNPIEIPGFRQS